MDSLPKRRMLKTILMFLKMLSNGVARPARISRRKRMIAPIEMHVCINLLPEERSTSIKKIFSARMSFL